MQEKMTQLEQENIRAKQQPLHTNEANEEVTRLRNLISANQAQITVLQQELDASKA